MFVSVLKVNKLSTQPPVRLVFCAAQVFTRG